MDTGIYAIINLLNGLLYVGSAMSISRRFTAHKHGLKQNTHHSRHLQHAYSEETKAKISLGQINRPPPSKETRANMSLAQKGKSHSLETKAKMSVAQAKRRAAERNDQN